MNSTNDENTRFIDVYEQKEGTFTGFVTVEGDRYPPMVRHDMPKNLRAFEVRDNDVFVITYPKAGTHWMTEIVKSVLADGDYEKGEKMFTIHPRPLEYFNTVADISNMSRDNPRVIVTHLKLKMLPKGIFNGKRKVVFVMRNPKDSAVSRFHFIKQYRYSEEWDTWDNFLQSFLSDDIPGGSWFDFNLAYWKHRNDKNFFITTYEDMKMDIKAVIKELAEFLGHPVSDNVLEKLVEIADYSTMSKKFNGRLPSGSASESIRVKFPFKILRKGKVGDWKNLLTVSQNEIFDEIYEKKMKESDMKSCIKFEL